MSITLLLVLLVGKMKAQEVTMQSLLREMVDREKLTEFPTDVPYRTLQASSYNRASVAPDQPGWFADADGVSCIRTEKNNKGETEWVLMEDTGPGVGSLFLLWSGRYEGGQSENLLGRRGGTYDIL